MPATIVQSNSGGYNAASGNATLPSGTAAGNTLILVVGTSSTGLSSAPTGFTADGPTFATVGRIAVYHKSNTSAGETSWALANTAQIICWSVLEVEGLDLDTPKDVAVTSASSASAATSVSTGTSPQSTTYDAFVVAVHSAANTTNGTVPSWSGQTGGFSEVTDSGTTSGTAAVGLAVSTLTSQQLGTFSSTATSDTTANLRATLVVYTAAGAKRAANVTAMAGFEWGTAAGLATGTAGSVIFDAVGGTPAVVTASPHTGSYCLELSASAAAEYAQWTVNTLGSSAGQSYGVARLCISFPSALPGADVDVFDFAVASGTVTTNQILTLRYRTASQKLGLQLRDVTGAVNGTEQLSAGTVAADTWYAIDLRLSSPSTAWTADWQIDGADQAQATVTATATTAVAALSLGWLAATTATVRYDDVVFSRTGGHYPLGDFRIYPLKPDPAGTLTVTTAANFQTFTANGTMAAWNAAAALAAIDDLPPTIGASADGIAQITAAATDYVEIPMETYDAAGNGAAVRAVRMYAAGWGAGSPAAATLGFRAWNGTVETTLIAAADPTFTNSTTVPGWAAKMYKPAGGWTQAQLDALAFRVGFSSDATPDIGIHSIMAEVAVRVATTIPLFGDGALQARDPDSAGVQAITATAPAMGTGGATLVYEEGGVPTTVPITEGATVTEPVGAPDEPTVNRITVFWPPEPDPVA